MNKTFTCICCPRGCSISVTESLEVSGNFCPRGKAYVLDEITHPTRTLTCSVQVSNRLYTMVSVKSTHPIPKEKIIDVRNLLKSIKVKAPIKIGDLILKDPLGIDVDIISTKNIE